MNYWTEESIRIANEDNYLDRLYEIYSLQINPRRTISQDSVDVLEDAYNRRDNERFLSLLIDIVLQEKLVSPIKYSYLSFLKKDPSAIGRNPRCVSRICDMLYSMPFEDIIDETTRPKETNRQMGPLFSNWIRGGALSHNMTDDDSVFLNSNENIVYTGNDGRKEAFAQRYLGYNREKGLDLLVKFNGVYVIGEAKYLSDSGGSQNSDFDDAFLTLRAELAPTDHCVQTIAIVDGVFYFNNLANEKIGRRIRNDFNDDEVILSAVLLKDYLETIERPN